MLLKYTYSHCEQSLSETIVLGSITSMPCKVQVMESASVVNVGEAVSASEAVSVYASNSDHHFWHWYVAQDSKILKRM